MSSTDRSITKPPDHSSRSIFQNLLSNGCILAKEVVCLGIFATISVAITTIGILGIVGVIPMTFTVMQFTVTAAVSGGVVTGVGALFFLVTLYGTCFVVQRNVDRAQDHPLGDD